jgi:predicted permease
MKPDAANLFARAWRRLVFRWRREKLERELAEEMEFHSLQVQAQNRRTGLAPEAALELSRRQMGNTTISREECRDMWSFVRLERLLQDMRYASRIFRRNPGFTAIAVLSLAVGIGGNAAMFSLVNALLIRPLPYPQPERLVRITGVYPHAALPFYREASQTMDIAAVSTESEYNLTGEGAASRVFGSTASANLFAVLGAAPARGRVFAAGEDAPGRDAEVILSDALWRTKFGGDPSVVGKVIALNGVNRQIIGIMPARFSYPSSKAELWIPLRLDPSSFLAYWGGGYVPLVGRLKPAMTLERARGELRTISAEFLKMYPYPMPRGYNLDATVIPLQQDLMGDIRSRLMILLCSVGVVLLIACTNVASLLLSRATARRREIALRTALGAGRARVVLQLLTESLLLALLGGALGIVLGQSVLSIFKSVLPAATPGLAQASIDGPVALAVAGLALLTGLAFGIAPALSASQIDLASTIRTGSQRSTGVVWTRLRSWLIGAEVALTVVLVVSAGLLIKSLYTLAAGRTGFESAGILTVRISPNQSFCKERTACVALYDRLLASVRDTAGVVDAAIADALPLGGGQPTLAVDVEGHPKSPEHPAPLFWAGAVSPAYRKMMQIPLLAGRDLSVADGANAADVVLISAATARHFWPGQSPLGKHIKSTGEKNWRTVVGVVGDVEQFHLGKGFPDFVPGALYMPYAQASQEDGQIPAAMTLMVQTMGSTAGPVGRQIRTLAQDQDPNIPVGPVTALDDVVAGSIADFRSTIRVFLSFAAAAILLAAIGVYGLVSYWVGQRTFEIGVRMAIGANRRRIVSMILGQGLRVAVYGTVAGIAASLVATRFLGSLLFGITASDPLTFAEVVALVLGVAAAATAFPAWRASRIDPTTSLRAE